MGNKQVYWLAIILSLVGLGLFLFKVYALEFPIFPGEKSGLWDIEARLTFIAKDKPVKASLHVPRNSRRFAIVDENFISRGYGLTTSIVESNREAVWSIRKAQGTQTLYYRTAVQKLTSTDQEQSATQPNVEPIAPLEGPYLAAAEALLTQAREQSADLDTLVAQLLKHLNDPSTDSNVALLMGPQPELTKKIETTIRLLGLAQIPARQLRGVRLEIQHGEASLLPWLQVYDEGKWRYYNPSTGEAGLPEDYLIFSRGNISPFRVKGAEKADLTITVRRTEAEGLQAATSKGRAVSPYLLEFSLLSLPIQTQSVYKVLLVIPIGAFLVLLMRNLIGVKTFGTFMPVLIALSFRETQLLWGLILFVVLISLGLSIRFYLERLKLLLVPRLTAVLIIVIFLMAMVSVLSNKLGLESGLSVALFPMVIITMTIERMSIVWEERGSSEAFRQGLDSLIVASLCYLLMSNPFVEHLMFVFPELLLVVLAFALLLGRYSGYRFMELKRFKAFLGS